MSRWPCSAGGPGALWVPGFEVAAGDPEGPTTFFAVRNTTDEAVEVDVAYHGERLAAEPLRTDVFTLGPRQTLICDVRADLTGLDVAGGVATGLVVISERGGSTVLEGDYFRIDSGGDFAAGDRLVRSEDFCGRQEIRFVDFGSGSRLRILLERPRGAAMPSFSYVAYSEAGAAIVADEVFTSDHLLSIDGGDLVRSTDLCTRQEIRFVDFGSGSRLKILLAEPLGAAEASFSYTAYDEAGTMIAGDAVFASDHLVSIAVDELVSPQRFGTLVFDFSNAGGDLVTAEYSAFGRFSVELGGGCGAEL